MKTFLHTYVLRIKRGFIGYLHAYKHEKQPIIIFVLLGIGIIFTYTFWPLREIETLLLLFSVILIIICELHNTALEAALDRLHPELHEEIGASKDIAAAATLTAVLFTLGIVAWIIVGHL